MAEYLAHDSPFQAHVFAAPDDFVWSPVEPILGEAKRRQQTFESLVNQFLEHRQGAPLSDGHLVAVRTILCVSSLQERETNVSEVATPSAPPNVDGA